MSVASAKNSIRPTYSLNDPTTEVYVGDCRQVLRSFAEKSIDLVFANPPFNLGVDYGKWQDDLARHEYEGFTREWIDECLRVLAPHGSIWINLPDHLAAEVVMHLKNRGLEMVNWCIWHFRFGVWRPTNFIPSKSHMLYFARSLKQRRWNPDDVLVLSDRASKYHDPRTRAAEKPGKRVPLDVWGAAGEECWGRVQGNNQERRTGHPNQLPELYLERVIRSSSSEGDLVLDPFLGSGTTCTVARALGRRSIGIEINAKFAKSAFERIQQGPVRVERAA
jgi:site-specific DNA-methyltransferase (adenine-specific)